MTRLLYLVSHPIQYQAPLLHRLARQPGLELRVLFEHVPSESGAFDPGFGRNVAWDVPLTAGYDWTTLAETPLAEAIGTAEVVWLHGWQGPAMRTALGLAARARRPVLMRAENWDGAMPDGPFPRSLLKRAWLRRIFSRCTAFLAIGSANRAYYRRLGVAAERIFPVPYAVDNDFFAARAEAEPLRAALGLPAGRKVVLYAGKMMPRKHPHTLLQAWQALPDRPLLLFAGTGELEGRLRTMAAGDPDVHFLGFRNQTELPALYALADVFVLASEREPWGLAINEAMACGTAVVASDQCGASADLVDETVGAVVPAGDVSALAAALARVLPQAATLGAAAQRRVAGWDFEADVAGIMAALAFVGKR